MTKHHFVQENKSIFDKDASRYRPRPELAAHRGGHVLVRESQNQLIPEQAVYRVQLSVSEESMEKVSQVHSWRVRVTIDAHSKRTAGRYLRQVLTVLTREAGF